MKLDELEAKAAEHQELADALCAVIELVRVEYMDRDPPNNLAEAISKLIRDARIHGYAEGYTAKQLDDQRRASCEAAAIVNRDARVLELEQKLRRVREALGS